ncbi:MAG: hypothetical protein WC994_07485 [Brumimicrobium sp.]
MKQRILILTILLIPFFGISQKVKLISGNPSELASETNFDVKVDFTNAKFYKENMSEADYINKRIEEIKADKGAAEAESWQADWERHKEDVMYEKFIHAINKTGKSGVTFNKDSGAKYTAVIKVDWVFPGWYGGVARQASKLNATISFIETSSGTEVLSLSCLGALGDIPVVGIPNNNDRISQAFDKVGVGVGKFMKKKFK